MLWADVRGAHGENRGLLKRNVPSAWLGKQAWQAVSLRGHGQASCVSLPASCPHVLPPVSQVLCWSEGWWEGRRPLSHLAARAKPLLFYDTEGEGSVQPRA